MRFFHILSLFSFFIFLLFPSQAISCSMIGPENQTYISPNGEYRFKVDIGNITLTPPEENIEAIDPSRKSADENRKAMGLLERKASDNQWESIWQSDLLNDITPLSVAVSDDGQYVATFGDWDGYGYGPNIIVIYDDKGNIKRNIRLENFLPDYYIDVLPTSSCGRSWKEGNPQINNNILSININAIDELVFEDGQFKLSTDYEPVEFLFDLDSGHISKKDTSQWIAALQKALKLSKLQLTNEQQKITSLTEPFVGKSVMEISEWHSYLREAFSRMVSPYEISGTTVLFPKNHERYRESLKWISDKFKDLAESTKYHSESLHYTSMASSDSANLTEILVQMALNYKDAELSSGHLMVAIAPQYWNEIEIAFSHTGLKLLLIDPLKPIPPSQEQLDKFFNPPPDNSEDDIFGL